MRTQKYFFLLLAFMLVKSYVYSELPKSGKDSTLKIAMLQMPSKPDQNWNLEKGEEYCRRASSKGVDIALFPEMVNIGYNSIDFDQPNALEKWQSRAISRNSQFVKHFQELAKELNMAIVITYLEKTDSLPKNSASLIDRHGNLVMTYSKVHTVDAFPMETAVKPGDDFYVTALDTDIGPVQVGIMTCYDREFPESARILMLKGAEVILTPNACGLDTLRLMQFRVRAWENSVVTAMANYTSSNPEEGLNGRSCIFSADGSEILIAGSEKGVYTGTVDIAKVREVRRNSYWGNAYRRPHKYHKIISPEVKEPFLRKNGFGAPFQRLER